LLIDSAGNIFGTTPMGGANGRGAAFELSPTSTGWNFARLFSFPGQAASLPNGGLIRDSNGNLYGTTYSGGVSSSIQWGTVFELSPPAARDK
jgi:uncharacterized repeat protein (TIGR03803 family)